MNVLAPPIAFVREPHFLPIFKAGESCFPLTFPLASTQYACHQKAITANKNAKNNKSSGCNTNEQSNQSNYKIFLYLLEESELKQIYAYYYYYYYYGKDER